MSFWDLLERVEPTLAKILRIRLVNVLGTEDILSVIENEPKRFWEIFKQTFSLDDETAYTIFKIVLLTIARAYPELGFTMDYIIYVLDGIKYGDVRRTKNFVEKIRELLKKVFG